MRTLCKTTESLTGDSGEVFTLDYYLLKKDVCVEGQCVCRYGIEICKRARRTNGTRYMEYRKIFDLFPSEAEAYEVLELMAKNTVTPLSMKDILEDMLGCTEFSDEVLLVETA